MGVLMIEFIIPSVLNLFDPLNIFLMVVGLAGSSRRYKSACATERQDA